MEMKKLKPKKVRGEKEQLYEEALSLKIQMNSLKEENIKLKTKAQILEKELNAKEDMIAELFDQKDLSTIGNIGSKLSKRKFESHLTLNLKR